jgi:hypothetical protein
MIPQHEMHQMLVAFIVGIGPDQRQNRARQQQQRICRYDIPDFMHSQSHRFVLVIFQSEITGFLQVSSQR